MDNVVFFSTMGIVIVIAVLFILSGVSDLIFKALQDNAHMRKYRYRTERREFQVDCADIESRIIRNMINRRND